MNCSITYDTSMPIQIMGIWKGTDSPRSTNTLYVGSYWSFALIYVGAFSARCQTAGGAVQAFGGAGISAIHAGVQSVGRN